MAIPNHIRVNAESIVTAARSSRYDIPRVYDLTYPLAYLIREGIVTDISPEGETLMSDFMVAEIHRYAATGGV